MSLQKCMSIKYVHSNNDWVMLSWAVWVIIKVSFPHNSHFKMDKSISLWGQCLAGQWLLDNQKFQVRLTEFSVFYQMRCPVILQASFCKLQLILFAQLSKLSRWPGKILICPHHTHLFSLYTHIYGLIYWSTLYSRNEDITAAGIRKSCDVQ